jgi:hypothetical protein
MKSFWFWFGTTRTVPVRVFRNRAEAEQFLLEYDPFEPVPAALNIDCSTPMFVDLITYRDAVPVSQERIRTVAEDGWEN